MKYKFPANGFVVKDSFWLFAIGFVASAGFAVLLCFHPGPAAMGGSFWVAFGIFASLALGLLYRLLTIKKVMEVNKKGIKFYRSGVFIKWNNFKSASFEEVPYDDGDTKEYLVIRYFVANIAAIQQINMPINSLLNKDGLEILEAIRHYKN